MKKVLAGLLCIILCLGMMPISHAEDAKTLRFGEDGKFKIMVFADCQDDENADSRMINFMNGILDLTKPDLVIFTGDNVVVKTEAKFKTGVTAMLNPVVSRNIPYAYTFGNHDDQDGVTKATQHKYYSTIGNCLTYDAEPALTGFGNCNLPILSSRDNSMAFNLWIVDSNTYMSGGGYDNVHADQQAWLKRTQNEITAKEGHIVPSMMFQHIIVPEVNDCIVSKKFIEGKGYGIVNENPCPAKVNSGQYTTVCEMGNVLGIVTGHDHINNFVAKPGPVDLISVSGMSYQSYGDDSIRGSHMIVLDESDLMHYKVEDYICAKYFMGAYGFPEDTTPTEPETPPTLENTYLYFPTNKSYISGIAFSAASGSSDARSALTSDGFAPIDYDLNTGARGAYIYAGVKYTNNPEEAIRSIRYLVTGSSDMPPMTMIADGCTYYLASMTDLNLGAGGEYIYGYYSKSVRSGNPIQRVVFQTTTSCAADQTICREITHSGVADLNAGTSRGGPIYCTVFGGYETVRVEAFLNALDVAENYTYSLCANPENVEAFERAKLQATAVRDTFLKLNGSVKSQDEIDTMTLALENATNLVGSAIVHSFPENTDCTVERACTKCGEILPASLHEMEAIIEPATCTEEGYTITVCAVCGTIEGEKTDIVPPLGHYFNPSVPEKVTEVLPEKTTWGHKSVECVRCDEKVMTYTAPAGEINVPTLKIKTGRAVPGRNVDVTLELKNNPGLAKAQMYLQYDRENLTLLSVQDSGLLGEGAYQTASDLDAYPYLAQWDNQGAAPEENADGNLVTFTFYVSEDAEPGVLDLKLFLKPGSLYDAQGKSVLMEINDIFIFAVENHIPGDANNDNALDLMDVAIVERHLAGGWNVTPDEIRADVNADGIVDLKDVVLMKRHIVGGWGVKLK